MVTKKLAITAVVSFIAGLLVYDIFFVDLYLATKVPIKETPERICPSRSSFTQVWDKWSDEFFTENPRADGDAQLREWNDLMTGIGCPQWVDPFRNVIATTTYTNANGSTTEIYQYELPEQIAMTPIVDLKKLLPVNHNLAESEIITMSDLIDMQADLILDSYFSSKEDHVK